MAKSLDVLLSNLTDDRSFTVEPSDTRFEAVVTVYSPIKGVFRARDSSARIALLEALRLADREA